MNRAETGRWGEDTAARYLEQLGYKIIERNYSRRCGEIDIITYKDSFICFVEVRTRAQGAIVSGAESIDVRKMRRVYKTAYLWLLEHEVSFQPRFDVVEIVCAKGGNTVKQITLIENAFGTEVCDEIF